MRASPPVAPSEKQEAELCYGKKKTMNIQMIPANNEISNPAILLTDTRYLNKQSDSRQIKL